MCKTLRPATLLLVLLLWPGWAAAQRTLAPMTVHMSYTGSALGMSVMQLQATVAMDQAGYRIDISYHTVGVLAVFVHSEQHTVVWGSWRGEQPEPLRFWSWGQLRGAPRETLIDYDNGRPVILRMTPPDENNREPVPEAERDNTIDTLSALAFLVRHVADTGSCDGQTRVFDGRRLSEIDAHTVGPVATEPGDTGAYRGETLHCAFAGRQLAGFMHDEGLAWQQRPHNGAAWIARVVPTGPPVPVRLTFETRWVGDIAMVLTDAGPGLLPAEPR